MVSPPADMFVFLKDKCLTQIAVFFKTQKKYT